MKCVCSSAVGASPVLCRVVCSHILQYRFDGCQLLVNPFVEVCASLFYRQFGVVFSLERCLVEEVKEIVVVQGAQEAHLGDYVVRHSSCLVADELVVERDIVYQTLVAPVHTR